MFSIGGGCRTFKSVFAPQLFELLQVDMEKPHRLAIQGDGATGRSIGSGSRTGGIHRRRGGRNSSSANNLYRLDENEAPSLIKSSGGPTVIAIAGLGGVGEAR